ncbi:MAG TPA: GNAT family protein [Bacilli bacterium]|nr:GNAT family protein [Bacilli bacterium]
MITIREVRSEDAENLNELERILPLESTFMLVEPGERELTVDLQQKRIQDMLDSSNSTLFVAVAEDGRIVGQLGAMGGRARRNKHCAALFIGILAEFQSQGVGTLLFEAVEKWALSVGLERLELTVMTHNEKGLGLYKKRGFVHEGTKRRTLKVNGHYVDEHMMGKLLTP